MMAVQDSLVVSSCLSRCSATMAPIVPSQQIGSCLRLDRTRGGVTNGMVPE